MFSKLFTLRFVRREEAATAVEYAVMLALILLVALVGIAAFGSSNSAGWLGIDNDLRAAGLGGS